MTDDDARADDPSAAAAPDAAESDAAETDSGETDSGEAARSQAPHGRHAAPDLDDPDAPTADAAPDAAEPQVAGHDAAEPESAAEPVGADDVDAAGEPPAADEKGGAQSEMAVVDGSYWQRRRARRAAKKARPRRKAPWWELPALIVLAILIAIVVKTFVVQPFYIPSQSMEKTLHGCPGCHGDRILVNKPIYDLRDPHPGDIVVFDAPKGWDDEPTSKPPSNPVVRTVRGFGQLIGFVPPDGQVLVKRVIAVGGQTVKGDTAGHVMVSTQGPSGPYRTLKEPYVYVDSSSGQRQFGPVTVPKGRLWVMGDHRNDSADSRYHCGPGGSDTPDDSNCKAAASTVPIDNVIGKAFVIAWPPSRWRTLGTPSTFDAASGAVTPILPAAASLVTVVPLFVARRRRRRRPPAE